MVSKVETHKRWSCDKIHGHARIKKGGRIKLVFLWDVDRQTDNIVDAEEDKYNIPLQHTALN